MLSLGICAAVLLTSIARAGRDSGADGRFSQRLSSHFKLYQDVDIDRYSGPSGSRQFERDVLSVLESAYRQVGDVLRIRPKQPIQVVIYDREIFDQQFSDLFGFRAAGFYDGRINVRGSTEVTSRLVRTLHHEYAHAALHDEARALFPAWLNEGLAEYFERLALGRRHLTPGENSVLVQAKQSGAWLPLGSLEGPSFAHLGGEAAAMAYLQSYAVIEHLARVHGERSLRDLCRELVRTRNTARALQRSYRRSLQEIEQDLLRELR